MKRTFGTLVAVVFLSSFVGTAGLYAEESAVPAAGTVTVEDLSADKQKVKEQHETMKANAGAAKSEEKALKTQIKEARKAGDAEKAEELKAQLKTVHKENVEQLKADKKAMQEARKEVRGTKKQLRLERKATYSEKRSKKDR